MCCSWNAYDQLLAQEKHRIRIRDLAYLVGFDSNDLQVLKDALRGLVETPLEWNVLHEDGDKEWGVASMLSQAMIRGGYCSYSYGPPVGLRLNRDYTAAATQYFAEMTRQRKQSDSALLRQTLAFAHGRLAAEKADYAEAVASYWEAAADICEAEAAFARSPELPGALLVRLGHLTELLLSPKLFAMLENLPAVKAKGEEDYANIVSGIRQEARALITEAKTKTGRMGREEAYIVLASGSQPVVINATYPKLLQLWKPTGESDEAARGRYSELEQAYAFLKQHGHT